MEIYDDNWYNLTIINESYHVLSAKIFCHQVVITDLEYESIRVYWYRLVLIYWFQSIINFHWF